MIAKSLPTERTFTYIALQSGGTTGVTYNGAVSGGGAATPMLQGVASSGKGILINGYNRAKIIVQAGHASATATITAYVSAGNVKNDDDSMTQLTGFSIALTASTDDAYYVADIDLRGAAHTLSTTSTANNKQTYLWLKCDQDGTTTSIIVELFDPEMEPATDSLGVVQTQTTCWPSTISQ